MIGIIDIHAPGPSLWSMWNYYLTNPVCVVNVKVEISVSLTAVYKAVLNVALTCFVSSCECIRFLVSDLTWHPSVEKDYVDSHYIKDLT